tara:strand:+ start:57 stop:827 length:771 start_codon:yes stop_codon:yes gene_type:complete
MLTLISSAKTLDFAKAASSNVHTLPEFIVDSNFLAGELRKLSPNEISRLMGVSEQLGEVNAERYKLWQSEVTSSNAKQALMAFKGDVYNAMDVESYKASDIKFAQAHLRILSGLYGLLRPMDLIQPYRLEMAFKFDNDRGRNLYGFWGDKIANELNKQLRLLKSKTIVNLASNEYFKAVKPKFLEADVVTPVFKDYRNGDYKIVSFSAKKARGLMGCYIIKNKILEAGELKTFDVDGYHFNKKLSSERELLFTRRQ